MLLEHSLPACRTVGRVIRAFSGGSRCRTPRHTVRAATSNLVADAGGAAARQTDGRELRRGPHPEVGTGSSFTFFFFLAVHEFNTRGAGRYICCVCARRRFRKTPQFAGTSPAPVRQRTEPNLGGTVVVILFRGRGRPTNQRNGSSFLLGGVARASLRKFRITPPVDRPKSDFRGTASSERGAGGQRRPFTNYKRLTRTSTCPPARGWRPTSFGPPPRRAKHRLHGRGLLHVGDRSAVATHRTTALFRAQAAETIANAAASSSTKAKASSHRHPDLGQTGRRPPEQRCWRPDTLHGSGRRCFAPDNDRPRHDFFRPGKR